MRRPWNITNLPVYSLVTFDSMMNLNMNICTYVSIVNMSPKIYSISIDYKSKTYDNLINNKNRVILQLLSNKNLNLVRSLGKKSGNNFDKYSYLKNNYLLNQDFSCFVLNEVSAFLELKNQKKIYDFKDHALFSFEIKKIKSFNCDILSFDTLIEKKLVL
mgnify:CR=1 FL=1